MLFVLIGHESIVPLRGALNRAGGRAIADPTAALQRRARASTSTPEPGSGESATIQARRSATRSKRHARSAPPDSPRHGACPGTRIRASAVPRCRATRRDATVRAMIELDADESRYLVHAQPGDAPRLKRIPGNRYNGAQRSWMFPRQAAVILAVRSALRDGRLAPSCRPGNRSSRSARAPLRPGAGYSHGRTRRRAARD